MLKTLRQILRLKLYSFLIASSYAKKKVTQFWTLLQQWDEKKKINSKLTLSYLIGWKGGPNSEAVKKFEDSVQFSGSNMQHKICSSVDAIGLLIILVSCLQNWQKCTLYFSCSARKNKQSVSSPLQLQNTTKTNMSSFS